MKISSEQIPQDIKDFILDIQERVKDTFNVYLGGGFIRDISCGLTPKDIDIFFIPVSVDKYNAQVGYVPPRCYVNYNKLSTDLADKNDMGERGVHQVIGMFNRKLSTPEIQFIVYSKYLTMESLAKDFDLSVCQVVWCPRTETIFMSEEFIEDHTHKVIRCLHEYDKERTYRRFERMLEKFPDYTPIGMPEIKVLPKEEQKARKDGTYKKPTFTGSFIEGGL